MRRHCVAAIVALTLVATGCMGWRSQIDPHSTRYDAIAAPAPDAPRKRLQLTLSVSHPDVPQQNQERREKVLRNAGLAILSDSGLFAEVGTDIDDPDLELVLRIVEEEHFNRATIWLSALTVFLVPVLDRVETHGVGEIYSGTGENLGELQVESTLSIAIALLALPLVPTAFWASSASQTDLFRSVLVQMAETPGVLQ